MTTEIADAESGKLNPFFSIWLSTRKTVRYVLDHKPMKYSLALAAIAGIPNSLNAGSELSNVFELPFGMLILGILIVGPLLGLLGWAISTVVYTLVGKLFRGSGTYREMGQAMGVVMIPAIWMTPFWILSSIFILNDIFLMNDPMDFSAGALVWSLVSSLIILVFSIWIIVIQSKAIGEVHQFSSWKGFGTLIIPAITFGIIFAVIGISLLLSFFQFT